MIIDNINNNLFLFAKANSKIIIEVDILGMFGQLKDIYNLRKQAAELQKQMESEKITVNSPDNLITLTINGNHELLDVKFLRGHP